MEDTRDIIESIRDLPGEFKSDAIILFGTRRQIRRTLRKARALKK